MRCPKNHEMKSGIPEGRQLSRATNNDKERGVCGPSSSASIMQLEAGELTEKKERAADNTKNTPPVQNIEIPLPPMPLPAFARAPLVAQAGFACLAPTATREKA